jgi:hypothetical protein
MSEGSIPGPDDQDKPIVFMRLRTSEPALGRALAPASPRAWAPLPRGRAFRRRPEVLTLP